MDEPVSVFPSSTHLDAWQSVNCARCSRGEDSAFGCDLAMAAVKSMYDDGWLPRAVAEMIGYLGSGALPRRRASPYWRCREFEPR